MSRRVRGEREGLMLGCVAVEAVKGAKNSEGMLGHCSCTVVMGDSIQEIGVNTLTRMKTPKAI